MLLRAAIPHEIPSTILRMMSLPYGIRCISHLTGGFICSPDYETYHSFLVVTHPVEVCTLSGQGTGLYPNHYSRAFASSTFPYPLSLQLVLRLAFPKGEITGLPSSVHFTGWGRSCLSAEGITGCVARVRSVLSIPLALWLKPVSTFGLSILTTFIDSSHPFSIPSLPGSLPSRCSRS